MVSMDILLKKPSKIYREGVFDINIVLQYYIIKLYTSAKSFCF